MRELLRKSLHALIAVVPALAAVAGRETAIGLLAVGALGYTVFEALRLRGISVPIVSKITVLVSRPRDTGFVLGPLTLAAGAGLTLLLFPPQAAAFGIYALAAGDGLAGLVGRTCGRLRPAWLLGKSLEGSGACLVAVFAVGIACGLAPQAAVFAGLAVTAVEALPLGDWDNVTIPLAGAGVIGMIAG
jgi:dolichol kinase